MDNFLAKYSFSRIDLSGDRKPKHTNFQEIYREVTQELPAKMPQLDTTRPLSKPES